MGLHPYPADASFDGGDLDCGNGLLLLIRKHIDPLDAGGLLEILSSDASVEHDLPAWCRLSRNELVSMVRDGDRWSFLVSKGRFAAPDGGEPAAVPEPPAVRANGSRERRRLQMAVTQEVVAPHIPETLPEPADAPAIAPLSVLPVGSWPRPRWLLRELHEHLAGRTSDTEFAQVADDAVRLAIAAQERAGIDVVTDGEQRRDSYASFVGGLLQNCQLIPITDLLPYVDDPDAFARELQALDVPAGEVRHPAVFGPLGRERALAADEVAFARAATDLPVKASLPGPYLLTRTMWMECVSDRAYVDRVELSRDVVRVLREEIAALLAEGAALVQLDEPVLSEVVFGEAAEAGGGRTFMCGALGERLDSESELRFAKSLLDEVLEGFPTERLALHVCRGNWTADESKALSGDYAPLVPLLAGIAVGTLVLELATPRAGELEALEGIRPDQRVAVGVVDQKRVDLDSVDAVVARAERAVERFGAERVLLTTDCGFATFADNPIVTAEVAERQLELLAAARDRLRARHSGAVGSPRG